VAAPWGFSDLLDLVLRPAPAFAADPAKRAVFEARCAAKAWDCRWPAVRILRGAPPA
jgi:hypothetical protein